MIAALIMAVVIGADPGTVLAAVPPVPVELWGSTVDLTVIARRAGLGLLPAAVLGLVFLAEGLFEKHAPYTTAGLVMIPGSLASIWLPQPQSFRWVSPILALGIGFLIAGILDHRSYLHLWQQGSSIGEDRSDVS